MIYYYSLMESKQNQYSQQVGKIQQQIKEISEYEHVKSIEKVEDYAYRISYRPFKTHSLYKDRTYNLLLTLPKTYPNEPPTLKFLNQIYHLNVGLHSGQVRMTILEDDWSPFLSLTSLMESLDKMLEEPDEDYAINTDVLADYRNNRQKYLNKVLQNTSLPQIAVCNTDIKQFLEYSQNESSQGISPVKIKNKLKKVHNNKKQNQSISNINKSKKFSQNLKISVQSDVQKDNSQQYLENRIPKEYIQGFGKIVQIQSCTETGKINKSAHDKLGDERKQSVKMQISESIKHPQYQNHPFKRSKTVNFQNTSSQNHQNIILQRISQTISIFVEELHQVEQMMTSSKNLGVKAMLKEKYDNQLEMLKELMEMSEDAKKRLVQQLKNQVNRM